MSERRDATRFAGWLMMAGARSNADSVNKPVWLVNVSLLLIVCLAAIPCIGERRERSEEKNQETGAKEQRK